MFKKQLLLSFLAAGVSLAAPQKPNVLFISVDDINDWISPMGGHPQAQTPHLDKFYKKGAVVFQNAVCAAPVCGPSRSAVLSGFMPHTTGVYNNSTNMLASEAVKSNTTLPEYFSKNGYHTLSTGKIFHKHATQKGADWGQWAFDTFHRATGKNTPVRAKYTHQKLGLVGGKKAAGPPPAHSWGALSWGPTKEPIEETLDYRSADWARQQLEKKHDQPFFMAIGISKPHLPWIVPQQFFDLYDLDSLKTAEMKENDLEDIKNAKGKAAYKAQPDYLWVKENGIEKEATRAYLASVSYADACLGVIFDALEKSGHADNTIVIVWGDHGYHLGEKLRYKKNTLWRETARTPLIVKLPNTKEAVICTRPISLIDLYPTLIKLCGLPEKPLDGHDFSPLLTQPDMAWERPGVTISQSGTSVLTEKWHYIETLKGTKELYDLTKDPNEWENLVTKPEHASTVERLRKFVPKTRKEAIKESKAPGKNKRNKAPLDESLKSSRDLKSLK